MRFGISATSSIFPKNFLTRFRPMNVCAIISSRSIEPSGPHYGCTAAVRVNCPGQNATNARRHRRLLPRLRGDQDDSPEGRNPSRPSGQASLAVLFRPIPGDPTRKPYRLDALPHSPGRDDRPAHLHLLGSPAVAPLARGFLISKHYLLKLNLGAHFFELGLDLAGVILVDAFLDVLRRALDQVLGFLEPKSGNGADFLDDLDLLLPGTGENDCKFSLFLCRRRSRSTRCRGSRGDRHRRSG